jgi:acetyltransferase-like isoleucine patch superfamily enzyme
MQTIIRRPLHRQMFSLVTRWQRLKGAVYYRRIFGSFGRGSRVISPMALFEPRFMHVGADVLINHGARLEAHATERHPSPELRIGDGVNIEQSVEIVCHNRVVIGRNVTVAGHCFISDTTHPVDGTPRSRKMVDFIADDEKTVEIGADSFIGFGCIILPGVHIGECCVIGAGSVVTKDVPAYSMAFGVPAQVVRSVERPG